MIKERVCFICVNISHVNNNFQTAYWLCVLHTEHDVYHAEKKRHLFFVSRLIFLSQPIMMVVGKDCHVCLLQQHQQTQANMSNANIYNNLA